jgi:hypothetical protein
LILLVIHLLVRTADAEVAASGSSPAERGTISDEKSESDQPAPQPSSTRQDKEEMPTEPGDTIQRRLPAPDPLPGRFVPQRPALAALPTEQQRKVNGAIDRGVAFLRQERRPSGTWMDGGHEVGYAALPGLTLLECGLLPDDPAVQQVARFVRSRVPNLNATYEVSLALLFLERLGDPKDRELTTTLALRLIVGQNPDGGWSYHCPILNPDQQRMLLAALEEARPESPADLLKPIGVEPRMRTGDKGPAAAGKDARRSKPDKPGRRAALPPGLRDLPALQERLEFRQGSRHGMSDNSNSQFAILALWTAGRQGLPVERPLALVVRRYQATQNQANGWGYHTTGEHFPAGPQSMICVGLLGLAVGHGLFRDDRPATRSVGDPRIEKALTALGGHIGRLEDHERDNPLPNLYFMWSLERVGVLYGLQSIDGKDWYTWGAGLLVAHQEDKGSWQGAQYPGSNPVLDTSFALLFLRRANLASDLTKKIEFLKIESAPSLRTRRQ